jgi:hypothetical protein
LFLSFLFVPLLVVSLPPASVMSVITASVGKAGAVPVLLHLLTTGADDDAIDDDDSDGLAAARAEALVDGLEWALTAVLSECVRERGGENHERVGLANGKFTEKYFSIFLFYRQKMDPKSTFLNLYAEKSLSDHLSFPIKCL